LFLTLYLFDTILAVRYTPVNSIPIQCLDTIHTKPRLGEALKKSIESPPERRRSKRDEKEYTISILPWRLESYILSTNLTRQASKAGKKLWNFAYCTRGLCAVALEITIPKILQAMDAPTLRNAQPGFQRRPGRIKEKGEKKIA
jgi:hypothetical protein